MTTSLRSRLGLETLDRRDVPATVTLSGGVLTIEGADSGESVSVSTWFNGNTGVRVTTPPQGGGWGTAFERQYAPGAVQMVVFRGNGGDDSFANSTAIPCNADGGSGHDTLRGGGGNDILIGGDGNDWVYGEGGHDQLFGGTGTDRVYGGTGDDHLCGEDFTAGVGDGSLDFLYGEGGADVFFFPYVFAGVTVTDFDPFGEGDWKTHYM